MRRQTSQSHELLRKAMQEIRDLLTEAHVRKLPEAGSASLATADHAGRPSIRTIYITAVRDEGLVFFVNKNSGKGRQLQENPQAGLCLFWPQLQAQVTLEGNVDILPDNESDTYWRLRPRDARVASWASDQAGEPIDHNALRDSRDQVKRDHDFEPIPRPADWLGLFLRPDRIEFWRSGWQHIRPRRLYLKDAETNDWQESLDNP